MNKTLRTKINKCLNHLSVPESAELTMHYVKPHVGLYGDDEWICWLNNKEAAHLINLGVEYGEDRKAKVHSND